MTYIEQFLGEVTGNEQLIQGHVEHFVIGLETQRENSFALKNMQVNFVVVKCGYLPITISHNDLFTG